MCNKSSTPVKKKTQQEPTKKLTLTQMYQGFTKRYNEENHILEGWKKVWIYGQFVYYDHEEMDLQADSYEQMIEMDMMLKQGTKMEQIIHTDMNNFNNNENSNLSDLTTVEGTIDSEVDATTTNAVGEYRQSSQALLCIYILHIHHYTYCIYIIAFYNNTFWILHFWIIHFLVSNNMRYNIYFT